MALSLLTCGGDITHDLLLARSAPGGHSLATVDTVPLGIGSTASWPSVLPVAVLPVAVLPGVAWWRLMQTILAVQPPAVNSRILKTGSPSAYRSARRGVLVRRGPKKVAGW